MFLLATSDDGIKAVLIGKVLRRNIDRLAVNLDSMLFDIYFIDDAAINAFEGLFFKDLIPNIALE